MALHQSDASAQGAPPPQTLAAYMNAWAGSRPARVAVAATVSALAGVSAGIADLLGQGALAGPMGRATGKRGDVDEQKEIDVLTNDRIVEALKDAPVAAVASEEMDGPIYSTPRRRFL